MNSHPETCGEWRAIAVDCGQALAERVFRVPPRFNDDAINTVLDRAGARLCACVTTKGVQSAAEPALDAIAVAFEARLVALDREATGPGGHA